MNRENENELPPPDDAGPDALDESEVARVFDAYLADVEAGRAVDPDRLIADHPKIAGELRACLEVMSLADRLADGGDSPKLSPLPREHGLRSASDARFTTTLQLSSSAPPRVQLRELPDDREPLLKARSSEMPRENGTSLGRFQLQGEIARGGMGAILKGRDVDLGRDLAIKVMLESHQGNPDIVNRFIEEAQIGGQLQHPGVVPVYELGAFPDRRPYFAMKLVKGRTLAALLAERPRSVGRGSPDPALPVTEGLPSPPADLPRFLAIFEQVCQTMAYAHARGVIHRDLKPSNVMVGSFGEVQVMDWGLAKVLPSGGIADEAASQPVHETVIATVRSGPAGSGSESQAGSVLGTPSYMAPEQARGEVERIDERADVFGLGAILCEILTGRPPFSGSSREEIRAQSARGDLADAMCRLDVAGADTELVSLTKACLLPEVQRRPRNASVLVESVTSYLTGVQERLRSAELARVEAQARVQEEAKRRALADELAQEAQARAEEAQARARIELSRRRRTVALAASLVGLVLLGGGGWTYLARQRMERTTAAALVLREVEILRDDAVRAGGDLARWIEARDAAKAVERLLADVRDEPIRSRLTELVRDLTVSARLVENDQNLLRKLLGIRAQRGEDQDGPRIDAEYAASVREAGIDIADLPPAAVSAKLHARPCAVRLAIAEALDDWAVVRRVLRRDQVGAARLTEAACLADPDPWRSRLRALLQSSPSPELLPRLHELASSAHIDQLPAVSIHLLGGTILDGGDPRRAEKLLREGQRLFPSDVWLNLTLARCLERVGRREEAIRYYMVARSLQPETAHPLADALRAKGETDQAIALYQELVHRRPGDGRHLNCLAVALQSRGRTEEANAVLELMIAHYRAAVRVNDPLSDAHFYLGNALKMQGKLGEAIESYREGLRLRPDHVDAYNQLGIALSKQGKDDQAVAQFRTAIRLKPDGSDAHLNLGISLYQLGKLDEAIAESREAVRLEPEQAIAYVALGNALHHKGTYDDAIDEFRVALRLKPDLALVHTYLGVTLGTLGKHADAITECREALRLKPDDHDARNILGIALTKSGRLREAIAEFREALRIKPDFADAHYNLGLALKDNGEADEAIAEYRQALRCKPDDFRAHGSLAIALAEQGKPTEAVVEYRESIRLKPDHFLSHLHLGIALEKGGKLDEAIVEMRESIRLKPDLAISHINLGQFLIKQGKLEEAMAECREALRVDRNSEDAHGILAMVLSAGGKLDEAIAEYRELLRLRPERFEAHLNLGAILCDYKHDYDGAIAEFRQALRLKPDHPVTRYNLGNALRQQGKFDEAIAEYRGAFRLDPALFDAQADIGVAFAAQGKFDEAIREFRVALRLKPDDSITHRDLGRVFRARGEFAQALAEFRTARDLARGNPQFRQEIEQVLTLTERQASLAEQLPSVLAKKLKPVDSAETLEFAQLCYDKKLHAASARLWSEAFQAQPKLADDMQVQHRYNAACAAALAGCGQGKDEPPLDDTAKARWRKQAIDWLKADLAAWSKILENGLQQSRQAVTQTLQHWKTDPDLAGVRDPAALAKLPHDEQKAIAALWTAADTLLKKAPASTSK